MSLFAIGIATAVFGIVIVNRIRALARRPPVFPLSPLRALAYRIDSAWSDDRSRGSDAGSDADEADNSALARVQRPGHTTVAVPLPRIPGDEEPYPTLGHTTVLAAAAAAGEGTLAFDPGSVEAGMWGFVLDSPEFPHRLTPFLAGTRGVGFGIVDGRLLLSVPGTLPPAMARQLEEQASAYRGPLAARLATLPERLLTSGPFIYGDVSRTYPVEAVLIGYAGTPHAEKACDILAHWVLSPAQPEGQRLRSLNLLAQYGDARRLDATVAKALRRGSSAVTLRALNLLAAGEARSTADALCQAGVRDGYGAAVLEALESREESDPGGVEAVLLAMIGANHPVPVLAAAIRMLGRVGTIAAVAPLVPLRTGVLRDAAIKLAAERAVDAIQARLEGVEAGGLSLVEDGPSEGGLSYPEQDGGVTLLPEDEDEVEDENGSDR